jgi:hypothetical protein
MKSIHALIGFQPGRCFQGEMFNVKEKICGSFIFYDAMMDGWDGHNLTLVDETGVIVFEAQYDPSPGASNHASVCVTPGRFEVSACGGDHYLDVKWSATFAGRKVIGFATRFCNATTPLDLSGFRPCKVCGLADHFYQVNNPGDCVACFDGDELDVMFGSTNCNGHCIPKGWASNPTDYAQCTAGPCSKCSEQILYHHLLDCISRGSNDLTNFWVKLSIPHF